jgi:hypothetical protein
MNKIIMNKNYFKMIKMIKISLEIMNNNKINNKMNNYKINKINNNKINNKMMKKMNIKKIVGKKLKDELNINKEIKK